MNLKNGWIGGDDAALLFPSEHHESHVAQPRRRPDSGVGDFAARRRGLAAWRLQHKHNGVTATGWKPPMGGRWIVYSEDAHTPAGVSRTRKATEETTPVAIALPQYPVPGGQIHAGLPVARTRLTLFANAQFDPLTSRRDFSDNEWNRSLVSLVSGLWSRAALDFFSRDPKAAWQAMPVPGTTEGPNASLFIGRLEGRRHRQCGGSGLRLSCRSLFLNMVN